MTMSLGIMARCGRYYFPRLPLFDCTRYGAEIDPELTRVGRPSDSEMPSRIWCYVDSCRLSLTRAGLWCMRLASAKSVLSRRRMATTEKAVLQPSHAHSLLSLMPSLFSGSLRFRNAGWRISWFKEMCTSRNCCRRAENIDSSRL